MLTEILIVVVALVPWLCWWAAKRQHHPPDDPWFLENDHKLTHHYAEGMEPGTMDHALQEAAAKKRAIRDARLSRERLEHTDPAHWLKRRRHDEEASA